MNTPDIELVLRAVEDARRILGEYVALDREDLVYALGRLNRRRVSRLVE
jgi:hypothetical protein